jgi:hypothetical protein
MKTTIASLLRHAVTAITGLGAWMFAMGWISEGDLAEVNTALVTIASGLVVVITAIVSRLALALGAKFFGRSSENDEGGKGSGLSALLLILGTTVALGGLPSCAALKGVPIAIGITSDQADVTYSSKGGLTVSARVPTKVDRRSSK